MRVRAAPIQGSQFEEIKEVRSRVGHRQRLGQRSTESRTTETRETEERLGTRLGRENWRIESP
jgi:hypothetical protein